MTGQTVGGLTVSCEDALTTCHTAGWHSASNYSKPQWMILHGQKVGWLRQHNSSMFKKKISYSLQL